MQKSELNFVIQEQRGYKYIYPHGYLPNWKDINLYPCGLKQKDYYKAEKEAKDKLRKLKCVPKHKAYRIIKRYIPIIENDLQLKLSFPKLQSLISNNLHSSK